MMPLKLVRYLAFLPLLFSLPTFGEDCCRRDIILEFKAACFVPTSSTFKDIFHSAALVGPELTVQIAEKERLYGFISFDYLQKSGHSIGLATPTKVRLLPIGIGLKYLVPLFCDCDRAQWYIGLGFQPTFFQTTNNGVKQSQWAFGGIAKAGAYIDLTCNLVLDIFINYSFVAAGKKEPSVLAPTVIPVKTRIHGAIFGAGLGWRF